MQKADENFQEQIVELNTLLNEIKYVQNDFILISQKNYKTTMKKLDKLHEYNKISDMTNQVFEKRITNIESVLNQIIKKLTA